MRGTRAAHAPRCRRAVAGRRRTSAWRRARARAGSASARAGRLWSACGLAAPAARQAWRAPAMPAARRLGATLGARGHDARAAGRLAVVRLPDAPEDAAVQARRATAAAGGAPTVLALGGARVAAFDALLADQDLVVVATPSGTDPALARLALAGLAPGTGAYVRVRGPARASGAHRGGGGPDLAAVRASLARRRHGGVCRERRGQARGAGLRRCGTSAVRRRSSCSERGWRCSSAR